MSNPDNLPRKKPRPKQTAQPDVGGKYEVSVATLVAAILSNNEQIENYQLFTNLLEAYPFDDVVAKVFFKGDSNPYAYAIQVKHRRKGETLQIRKVKKYLNGYSKILNNGGLKTIDIAVDKIHFCYFCIKNVRVVDYTVRTHNPGNEWWESVLIPTAQYFQNCNTFYKEPINEEDKKRQDFFDKFYFYFHQPNINKIKECIQSLCKVNDAIDILKYVDTFFEKQVLWQSGLRKEIFETELLKIRLTDYILSPAAIIQLNDSQTVLWNELILQHNATIIKAETNIEKSLFGCLAQMLNCALNIVIDWEKYMTSTLDSIVKSEFNKLFTVNESGRIRHWIDPPTTLKSLIIELWKCGKSPLILKSDNDLPMLKDYIHLNKCYIIITDDLFHKRQECERYNLKTFTYISDVTHLEMRNKLLGAIPVSLQGRKPVTLYSIINHHKQLATKLSCSHILHLMKTRKAYLSKEYVNGNSDHNTVSFVEDSNCPAEYKLLLRDFFVDQDGEDVYCLEDSTIPILGYRLRSHQQNYIPRFLRSAAISKSLFDSRIKGICFISGDLNDLDLNIKANMIKVPWDNIEEIKQLSTQNVFINIEGEDIEKYWEKVSTFELPVLHIRVEDTGMQLCRYIGWKDLSDHISFNGREISERNFLTTITKGITIVTGEAGIGKSSLLRSLFKNHCKEKYILFYNLADYALERKNKSLAALSSLDFILNKFKNTRYNEFLCELFRQKEKLLVILDSFDEVLASWKEEILNFIRNLAANDIQIIIASRLRAICTVMDNFATNIFKVDMLGADERKEYIENSNLRKEVLTTTPLEFLGNPLYLNFLKIISKNSDCLGYITKLNLFKNIIQIKLNQYIQNYLSIEDVSDEENAQKCILELHQKLALMKILGVTIVQDLLNWKYPKGYPNIFKLGIIVSIDEDCYPTFEHEMFAEYLTADWVIRNQENDSAKAVYLEILRQEKLYVLDIICEHLGLHKAILDRNEGQIAKYAEDRSHLEESDDLGRMGIHMVAAHHKSASWDWSPIDTIIGKMSEFKINFTRSDNLIKWNWVQHLNQGNDIDLMLCIPFSIPVKRAYLNCIVEKLGGDLKLPLNSERYAITPLYMEAMEEGRIDMIRNLFFIEDAINNDISLASKHRKCQTLEADTLELKKIRQLTPLHVACIYGNVEVVREFVKLKYEVNATDSFGCIPLHYSVINPPDVRMDMTKILLENGSEMDTQNCKGKTAASIAIHSGNLDVAKLFSQKGVPVLNSIENDMRELVFRAIDKGDKNMMFVLFQHQLQAKSRSRALTYTASTSGLDVAELSVEDGRNDDSASKREESLVLPIRKHK